MNPNLELPSLYLKKGEERRLEDGHVWIYSNEIETGKSPLKNFESGSEVLVLSSKGQPLGRAYINPHSLITARLFTTDANEALNEAFFYKKLALALQLRERLYPKPFYRLCFAESDGIPGLVIDRYGDHLVGQCNTYGIDIRKRMILDAVHALLPNTLSFLWRNDSAIRKSEGLPSCIEAGWGQTPTDVTIEENDTLFYVPLMKGQKTGWFYDHRTNRKLLASLVSGKKVLDVFSYLGAFAIEAGRFNASELYAIDTSAFACDYIKRNAALNHLDDKIHVICDDAVSALQSLAHQGESFEVIIVDPPAFIKRNKDIKEGLLAYQRINMLALRLLKEGGILLSSSCSMHLSEDDLITCIRKACRASRTSLQIIDRGHQASDHPVHIAIPETSYLKMVCFRRMA